MDDGLRITVGNEIYFERTGLMDELQSGIENDNNDLRNQLRANSLRRPQSRSPDSTTREDYYDRLHEELLRRKNLTGSFDSSLDYDESYENEQHPISTSYREEDMDLGSNFALNKSSLGDNAFRRKDYDRIDSLSCTGYPDDFNQRLKYEEINRTREQSLSPTEELSNKIRSRYGLSSLHKGREYTRIDDDFHKSFRDMPGDGSQRHHTNQNLSNSDSFSQRHDAPLKRFTGSRNFSDAGFDDSFIYERYADKPKSNPYCSSQHSSSRLKSPSNLTSLIRDMPPPMPEASSGRYGHDSKFLNKSSSVVFKPSKAFDCPDSQLHEKLHSQALRNQRSQNYSTNRQQTTIASARPSSSNTSRTMSKSFSRSNYGKQSSPRKKSRNRSKRGKFIYVKPGNPGLQSLAKKYKYATSGDSFAEQSHPSPLHENKKVSKAQENTKIPEDKHHDSKTLMESSSKIGVSETEQISPTAFDVSMTSSQNLPQNNNTKQFTFDTTKKHEEKLLQSAEKSSSDSVVQKQQDKATRLPTDTRKKLSFAVKEKLSKINPPEKVTESFQSSKNAQLFAEEKKFSKTSNNTAKDDKVSPILKKSNFVDDSKAKQTVKGTAKLKNISNTSDVGKQSKKKANTEKARKDFFRVDQTTKSSSKNSGIAFEKDASVKSKQNNEAFSDTYLKQANCMAEEIYLEKYSFHFAESDSKPAIHCKDSGKKVDIGEKEHHKTDSIEQKETVDTNSSNSTKNDKVINQETINIDPPISTKNSISPEIELQEKQENVDVNSSSQFNQSVLGSRGSENKSDDLADDAKAKIDHSRKVDLTGSKPSVGTNNSKQSSVASTITPGASKKSNAFVENESVPQSKTFVSPISENENKVVKESVVDLTVGEPDVEMNMLKNEEKSESDSTVSTENKVMESRPSEAPMQISTPYSQTIHTVLHHSAQKNTNKKNRLYKPVCGVVSKPSLPPNLFQSKSVAKPAASIAPTISSSRPYGSSFNMKPVPFNTSSNFKVIPTIATAFNDDTKGSNPSNLVSIHVETEEERKAKRLDYLEKEMEKLKKQQANMWLKKQKQDPSNQGKVMDSMKKQREIPELAKKEPPKPVVYDYYDGGDHFCSICCRASVTMLEHMCHLHTTEHSRIVDTNHKPWLQGKKPLLKINADKSLPVGGMEFVLPVSGYYCELCDCTTPDASAAVMHCSTQEHNQKYSEFCKKNPVYEASRKTLVKQIQASRTIAQSLGLPLPLQPQVMKEPSIAPDSRIKITLPTLPRYFEPPSDPTVTHKPGSHSKRKRNAHSSEQAVEGSEKRKKKDKNGQTATASWTQPKPIASESIARSVQVDRQSLAVAQSIIQDSNLSQKVTETASEDVEMTLHEKEPTAHVEKTISQQASLKVGSSAENKIKETSLFSDASDLKDGKLKQTPEKVSVKEIGVKQHSSCLIPGLSNSDDDGEATSPSPFASQSDEICSLPLQKKTVTVRRSYPGDVAKEKESRADAGPKTSNVMLEKVEKSDPDSEEVQMTSTSETKTAFDGASTTCQKSVDIKGSTKMEVSPSEVRKSPPTLRKSSLFRESESSTVSCSEVVETEKKPVKTSCEEIVSSPSTNKPKKTAENIFDFTSALVADAIADTSIKPVTKSARASMPIKFAISKDNEQKRNKDSKMSLPKSSAQDNSNYSTAVMSRPKESTECNLVSANPNVIISKESDNSKSDNIFERFTLEGNGDSSGKESTLKSLPKTSSISTGSESHGSSFAPSEFKVSSSHEDDEVMKSKSDTRESSKPLLARNNSPKPKRVVSESVSQSLKKNEVFKSTSATSLSETSSKLSAAVSKTCGSVKFLNAEAKVVPVSSVLKSVPALTEADSESSSRVPSVPINAILARRTAPSRALRSNTNTYDSLPIARDPVVAKKPAQEKARPTQQKARKSIRPSRSTRSSGTLQKVMSSEPPPPGTEDDI